LQTVADIGGAQSDVLVVGDWFVDAHWVVGPHRSDSASRTGHDHAIALHGLNSTVRELGGAGQVMSLLSSNEEAPETRKFGQAYGLGSWHPGDDAYIQSLLDPQGNEGDNPFFLAPKIKAADLSEEGRRVFRLYCDASGTNRVIRVYRKRANSSYSLDHRIDFEQELPNFGDVEITEPLRQVLSRIKYVLVKDHGRGLVNPKTLEALCTEFSNLGQRPQWFISTKNWHPKWLHQLKHEDIKLLLMPPEASSQANVSDAFGSMVHHWLVSGRVPSRRAMQSIDEIRQSLKTEKKDGPVVIVLPSRSTVLARFEAQSEQNPAERQTFGLVHGVQSHDSANAFIPRSGILFAALFSYWCRMELNPGSVASVWQDWLASSISLTDKWVESYADRIRRADTWRAQSFAFDQAEPPARKPTLFDWSYVARTHAAAFVSWPSMLDDESWSKRQSFAPTELKEVRAQSLGFGILQDSHKVPRIELWRAMSEVDGCIGVPRAKRAMLADIAREIDMFVKSKDRVHRSFLVSDDPGGGKTTMIRLLAEGHRMRFLSFNVTELMRKSDLLGCFDTIVTTQAQDPSTPILVFIDEINAKLEGESIYSAFLAPLEDGHYSRDGKTFWLEPCVWVFAGTENPLKSSVDPNTAVDLNKPGLSAVDALKIVLKVEHPTDESDSPSDGAPLSDKTRDFGSRLSKPPFELKRSLSVLPKNDKKIKESLRAIGTPGQEEVLWSQLGHEEHASLRGAVVAWLIQEGRTLERVYVGVQLIKKLYPEVEEISSRVISALACLPDKVSLRDIRHELQGCTEVQRGRLKWMNMSRTFREEPGRMWNYEHKVWHVRESESLEELTKDVEDRMVKIIPSLSTTDMSWTGMD